MEKCIYCKANVLDKKKNKILTPHMINSEYDGENFEDSYLCIKCGDAYYCDKEIKLYEQWCEKNGQKIVDDVIKKIKNNEHVDIKKVIIKNDPVKNKKNYEKYKDKLKEKRESKKIGWECKCGKKLKNCTKKSKEDHLKTKLHKANIKFLLNKINKPKKIIGRRIK